MNTQQQLYVVQKFAERAQSFQLKKGSKKYQQAQEHFLAGAMSAWCSSFETDPNIVGDLQNELRGKAMPPSWVFGLMRGDDVVDEALRAERIKQKLNLNQTTQL